MNFTILVFFVPFTEHTQKKTDMIVTYHISNRGKKKYFTFLSSIALFDVPSSSVRKEISKENIALISFTVTPLPIASSWLRLMILNMLTIR